MKNKKGFTLIELLVSFTLITVVSVSLFKTVLAVQKKAQKDLIYNQYISFAATFNNAIEEDFTSDTVTTFEICGTNCYNIVYEKGGTKKLEMDKENGTLSYGSIKEKLPSNYFFYGNLILSSVRAVIPDGDTLPYNSILAIVIPIKSNSFNNTSDIRYLYQYNDENDITSNLNFTLTVNPNSGTYDGSTSNTTYTINLNDTQEIPNPTRSGYVFTGWNLYGSGSEMNGTTFKMGSENATLTAGWILSSSVNATYAYNASTYYTYTVSASAYYLVTVNAEKGTNSTGSNGATVSGVIYMNKDEKYYIFSGGHSMDVRYYNAGTDTAENLTYASNIGLNSRIIVAGGGGDKSDAEYPGAGYGGTYVGGSGNCYNRTESKWGSTCTCYAGATGGTMTSGGLMTSGDTSTMTAGENGYFGLAGGPGSTGWAAAALGSYGGNGYYGGGGGRCCNDGSWLFAGYSGGGGSSFVSGLAGVNAVASYNLTNNPRTHANNTKHYSGKYFLNGSMIAANSVTGSVTIQYVGNTYSRTNTNLDGVRYIKDCISGSNVDSNNHWLELQAIYQGSDVAKGKISTGSITNVSYLTDGNLSTSLYASAASGTCALIDLGRAYDLDEVAVWHYYPGGRTYNSHTLSVSSDNTNWKLIMSGSYVETADGKHYDAY